MIIDDIISEPIEFEWDKGNINKNLKKHGIKNEETEEVFANQPLLVFEDLKHSKTEKRHFCLGVTDTKKNLYISFTKRKEKIRIISARIMSRRERKLYAKEI